MDLKILLIEDDAIWQSKIKIMLQNIGCKWVKIVNNLIEAQTIIDIQPPDCIISDIFLGGNEISYHLLSQKIFSAVPKIFITVSEKPENLEKCIIIENSLLMIKPFQELSLKAAISYLTKKTDKDKDGIGLIVKGKQNIKIFLPLNKIIYIRSNLNYCRIFTENAQFIIKESIKGINSKLKDNLLRVH